MIYIAIIGDIIDSQKISNRQHVQDRLENILNQINEDYQSDIVANFAITLGDEFQGLLQNAEPIMTIIQKIEFALYPIEIRLGIGMGEVSTEIKRDKSHEVDGPAYYQARKMIDQLKETSARYEKVQRNIFVSTSAYENPNDALLNATLSVCYAIRKDWTDKQYETIQTYLTTDENQYRTAEKLEVSQSTVSRSLLNSKYYTYEHAIRAIKTFLVAQHEMRGSE